jgi:hypothetical protein
MALLQHMRELMPEEVHALVATRRVLLRPEDHVLPDRVGQRIDGPHRGGRGRIGVNPHPAQVMGEPGFHELPGRRIERLAGCRYHLVYDGWHAPRIEAPDGTAL